MATDKGMRKKDSHMVPFMGFSCADVRQNVIISVTLLHEHD